MRIYAQGILQIKKRFNICSVNHIATLFCVNIKILLHSSTPYIFWIFQLRDRVLSSNKLMLNLRKYIEIFISSEVALQLFKVWIDKSCFLVFRYNNKAPNNTF